MPPEMGRVGHLSFIQTNYTSILPHEWGNGIDHDKIDKSPPSPPCPQVGGVGPTIDNNSTGIILCKLMYVAIYRVFTCLLL